MERSRTSVLIQSELAWRMMLKIEQRLGNLSSKTNAKFSGRQREWPGRQIWRCLKRPIDLRCSRRYDRRDRADYRESPCFLLQVLQIFVVILWGLLVASAADAHLHGALAHVRSVLFCGQLFTPFPHQILSSTRAPIRAPGPAIASRVSTCVRCCSILQPGNDCEFHSFDSSPCAAHGEVKQKAVGAFMRENMP